MLFSRNPISGELESYTDDGVYAGHVFTMGDFIGSKTANDEFVESEHKRDEKGRFVGMGGSEGATMKEPDDIDEEFDIFSFLGEEEKEDPEQEKARKEAEEKSEKEQKQREDYGQNGLAESEYPEELRFTDKERKAVMDVYRSYKDDNFKTDVDRGVMDALNGLLTTKMVEDREKKYAEKLEKTNEMIARRKAEGYVGHKSTYQEKKDWYQYLLEFGEAPPPQVGESGIRHWQIERNKALNGLKWAGLEKKIIQRREFAEKSDHYMPWRKSPNADNPRYKPWTAQDGGPGSGNFGHRGRPGKRGGSQKGGGGQYRGGRSDIGYFNSRTDWLNGLSGERQHEASQRMGWWKEDLEHKQQTRSHIDSLFNKGILTKGEYDDALQRAHVENIKKDMTTEEYVMEAGSANETNLLLTYVKEARNWDKYKDRLIDENLSEEDKKLYDALVNTDKGWAAQDRPLRQRAIEALESKALGIADYEVELSDEIHYRLGTKERPAPPEPPKNGPDYSWYEEGYGGNLEGYIASVTHDGPSYGHKYTRDEFAKLNQDFVDKIAFGKPSPKESVYYATEAINSLRNAMRPVESVSAYGTRMRGDFVYTKEMQDRLSDEEKKQLLKIVNDFSYPFSFKSISELGPNQYFAVEQNMRMQYPKSKADRQPVHDYILLQEKMLTGCVPSTEEERQSAAEAEKAAEAKKKAEGANKRAAHLETPEAKAEIEEAKKMRAAREKGEKPRKPDCSLATKAGDDYYEDVSSKMDACDNTDIKVAWDIYHDVPVNANKPDQGSWYGAGVGEVFLNLERAKNGDSIHSPYESVYHEVGHAIDFQMADKMGYEQDPHSFRVPYSSFWNDGEFLDTIEEEAKKFIDDIAKIEKARFESSEHDSEFYDRYYDRGSQAWWDVKANGKKPKWSVKTKNNAVASWLNDQDHLQYSNICDMIQGATRSGIVPYSGHKIGYYKGADARANMGTEVFAELYSAWVASPKALDAMRKHMPKTVKCFERMIKEVADRG